VPFVTGGGGSSNGSTPFYPWAADVTPNPELSQRDVLDGQTRLRDRQARRDLFAGGAALVLYVLGALTAVAAVVAPLTQLHSFHQIIWWWRVWVQHPWLEWTIRGLSIYGLVVFAGLLVLLGSEGSGPKPRRSKRTRRRRSKKANELPSGCLAGLIALAIPSFVLLAVFCTILAPFLGLFGLYMAYAVLTDLRGSEEADDSSLAPPSS
jgi:hypothetical protein